MTIRRDLVENLPENKGYYFIFCHYLLLISNEIINWTSNLFKEPQRQSDGDPANRGEAALWPEPHQSKLPLRYMGGDLKVFAKTYRVTHLLADLGWFDFDLGCTTVLLGQRRSCSTTQKPVEHPKSKSTQPMSARRWVTLYSHVDEIWKWSPLMTPAAIARGRADQIGSGRVAVATSISERKSTSVDGGRGEMRLLSSLTLSRKAKWHSREDPTLSKESHRRSYTVQSWLLAFVDIKTKVPSQY